MVPTLSIGARAGAVMLLAFAVLAGCVGVGDVASRPREVFLARLLAEGSTQADLERHLGKPTAVQVREANGRKNVSWAYGYAQLGTQPARYIPFLGVIAVEGVEAVDPSSFAVSFSDEGIIAAITQRRLARYTIEVAPREGAEPVTVYGTRNLTYHPGSAILRVD